jgi:predicted nucleotide-binding protein (sugar kinase/HSP70/actin superfamily)
MGMPQSLRSYLWDALLAADMTMKAVLKTRPYEVNPGETDRVAEKVMSRLERRIEQKADLLDEIAEGVSLITSIPQNKEPRPLVGIVGEIYVRCNPFCNDNVIRVIEASGGEAWLAPISEWVLYTSWFEKYYADLTVNNPIQKLLVSLKTAYLFDREKKFEQALHDMLADRFEPYIGDVLQEGSKHLPLRFEGEAILTIGRTCRFFEDGASLVVNCAPFGCMPGNITASLFAGIQQRYGKPVLTLFYDGETSVNRAVEVYLRNMGSPEKVALR